MKLEYEKYWSAKRCHLCGQRPAGAWRIIHLRLCKGHQEQIERLIELEAKEELNSLRRRVANLETVIQNKEIELRLITSAESRGLIAWAEEEKYQHARSNQAWKEAQAEALEMLKNRKVLPKLSGVTKSSITWTYYARCGEKIKIGKTTNVEKRMVALNGGVQGADHVKLLAVELGDVEGSRHLQFRDLRLSGEWFLPGPSLLETIEQLPKSINEALGEAA